MRRGEVSQTVFFILYKQKVAHVTAGGRGAWWQSNSGRVTEIRFCENHT